jgi:hypothetical protein
MQYYYAWDEFTGRLICQDTNRTVVQRYADMLPAGRVLDQAQYDAVQIPKSATQGTKEGE